MIESVMMMMDGHDAEISCSGTLVSLVPGSSCSHAGSHELLLDLTVLYGHGRCSSAKDPHLPNLAYTSPSPSDSTL